MHYIIIIINYYYYYSMSSMLHCVLYVVVISFLFSRPIGVDDANQYNLYQQQFLCESSTPTPFRFDVVSAIRIQFRR